VLVKHLFAIGPVEALDEGVLVGLPGLDVLDGQAATLRPLDKGFSQELFRKSLADYLTDAGEHEVAQIFSEQA
jgi:hypothetical protein